MQNIPVPNQAAMLNNTAASAAAARTAKQANSANDGPAFKEVLAKQVQQESKQTGGVEQVLQRQRMQLQPRLTADALEMNPELVKPELLLDPTSKAADITLPAIDEEVLPHDQEALSSDATALPLPVDGQLAVAAVTPDVQRKSVVAVAEEFDDLGAKRGPVEWLGKDHAADIEPKWDKAVEQLTAQPDNLVASKQVATTAFADALDQQQLQQVQAHAVATTPQVQPAQQSQAAIDVRSNQVTTPFGQPGWNQAIGQKVVWMAAGGEQTASLTLNPPDLGPVQVVIHVHNNQADTTFLSDQADVRRALEDGMDNLRQMMSESGLQLGQANVRSGQQEAQQQAASQQRGQLAAQGEEVNQVLSKAATVMGLVDTFA